MDADIHPLVNKRFFIEAASPGPKKETMIAGEFVSLFGQGEEVHWSSFVSGALLAALGVKRSFASTCIIPTGCVAGIVYPLFKDGTPIPDQLKGKIGLGLFAHDRRPSVSIHVSPMVAGLHPHPNPLNDHEFLAQANQTLNATITPNQYCRYSWSVCSLEKAMLRFTVSIDAARQCVTFVTL